jgi:hypothetical protein
VWLRSDGLGATAVLESTPEGARLLTADFPMARAGLVTFACIPVRPFAGLEMLFGRQDDETPAAPLPQPLAGARTQTVLARLDPAPGADSADMRPHLTQEARQVWALWKAGGIREPYVRTDGPGAVLVMEAADAAEAETLLSTLPLVAAGLLIPDCMTVSVFSAWEALLQGGFPQEETG